ncbi:hypothetical protein APHAL10511_005138 [Amanita phalloides]|nr:hypothetical protein APHAL10511_005138 [Amanita phalloides]
MPYDGSQRKLIIAFDVGTTFSGVTYAFLIPQEPPVIQGVTQFPGQKKLSTPYFIRFGRSESEPQFDIRLGSVKISGSQIAEFFEPAIQKIIEVIEEQSRTSSVPIKAIFMVGGFATSDHLFFKLNEHFKPKGINILRPDAYLNKAVAEGAIIFNITHSVTSRVSKYAYGTEWSPLFNREDPDHVSRAHKCIERPSGDLCVPSGFSTILPKDTGVSEEKEFKQSFYTEYNETEFRGLSTISEDILCYRNRWSNVPLWIDQAPDLFPTLCVMTADVSGVKESIRPKINPKTRCMYYELKFDIILLFGLTELRAQIAWNENGVERRGPASIIYDIANEG